MQPLSDVYPVNSVVSITLVTDEVVEGTVYATDEFSKSIILRVPLKHTVLSSEVRVINSAGVSTVKIVKMPDVGEGADDVLNAPLPAISKKSLEEREKRAIRLAEESFGHINEKASPAGQAIFDRLVKACNDVVWKGERIVVLNQVRVEPPYGINDCSLITTGNLNEGSLERVKKIVAG
mmetsp:Transcript_20668/g.26736  ORF Transcript_20668/g.26736 Transcript_20668/m.26736 type:complete len:179 (+) Transcript_20668:253-789(+)